MSIENSRDEGLRVAIEAAGGVGRLAALLGISQPSVSNWQRVPAERVLSVEALTGVSRTRLRPDIYPLGDAAVKAAEMEPPADPVEETDRARAEEYLLLATLLRAAPDRDLLDRLASVEGDDSALGRAHRALALAAREADPDDIEVEYFDLFIGVGRGELLPYASYYLTGFLNERPLAKVREDLARFGVIRQDGVVEPEDHLATLFEMMAGLLLGLFGDGPDEAEVFRERHIARWARRCFDDLGRAKSARFYRAVAALGTAYMDIEQEAASLA
jgi:TorA maturation chaperone TorD